MSAKPLIDTEICPNCEGIMDYQIHKDLYVCRKCHSGFELSQIAKAKQEDG